MNGFLKRRFPTTMWRSLRRELNPRMVGPATAPAETTAQVIASLLGERRVSVIDVGARWGVRDAWWRISPLAGYIGFDADPKECARLNALVTGPAERYVPVALGARTESRRLHMTAAPEHSSLYPPDESLSARYPDLSNGFATARELDVDVVPLDHWIAQETIDDVRFMKLDTQGSELDILKGAERTLSGCLGLEVEVEFSPLYRDQPLFAEVDSYLRAQGFSLWRLTDLCHYAEDRMGGAHRDTFLYYGGMSVPSVEGSGRLFFGNAIYFRDFWPLQASAENAAQILVTAAFLGGLGDLAGARAALTKVLDWGCPGLAAGADTRLREHRAALQSCSQAYGERPLAAMNERITASVRDLAGRRSQR